MRRPLNTIAALRTEALRLSRNAVKQELRERGIRLSSFAQADLNRLARAWFEGHRRELIEKAWGVCWPIGSLQNSGSVHKKRISQNQWLRLCKCQAQNDRDRIRQS
jgi:hypothetical protein